MNNQLIPVFPGQLSGAPVQLVDARLMHQFLEVARDFSTWIKDRVVEYGFLLNIDYLEYSPKSGKKGRPIIDYHLSIDMAKELGMIERNEKGRQIRRYFLDMERIAQYGLKQLPEPPTITKAQIGILFNRVNAIAGSDNKMRSAIWKRFQNKFTLNSYKELPADRYDDACAYLNAKADEYRNGAEMLYLSNIELAALVDERFKALAGEIMPKIEGELLLKAECPKYQAPLSDWHLSNTIGAHGWLTYKELIRVEPSNRPLSKILHQLKQDGNDIEGAMAEYDGMKLLLDSFYWKLDALKTIFDVFDKRGLNIRSS